MIKQTYEETGVKIIPQIGEGSENFEDGGMAYGDMAGPTWQGIVEPALVVTAGSLL